MTEPTLSYSNGNGSTRPPTPSPRSPSLIDRTLRSFRRALGLSRSTLEDLDPSLPKSDLDRVRQQIDACLEAKGGEVSARARAAELGESYLSLNEEGRRRFLELLATDYDVDQARVDAAIAERANAAEPEARRVSEYHLREALVPPRVRLLSKFNDLSQGVKFLVDLRAELIAFAYEDKNLAALDRDVKSLLASWFDVGFLDLTRITWSTPASLLEKLIEYEAVHAIRSWVDLKNRLEADRRCYAFFHPRMPEEPLIFVQVALVNGMSDDVQGLLDESAPLGDSESADTAIFYSISNCQRGLAGVSFGNFLIKRVANDLAQNLRNLKSFATLSPMPGFRSWLEGIERERELFTENERTLLTSWVEKPNDVATILALMELENWEKNPSLVNALESSLLSLGAEYLLRATRGDTAIDPVCHFHLSNGARIERINWLADTSPKGLKQSGGMMVNYLYKLDDVDRNHEAYRGGGKRTAATSVRKLLK